MTMTLFIVTARVPILCNDGRDPAIFWGHEAQYHATRETAEAACGRLRASGGYGCNPPPEYDVAEFTRADFAPDPFGEEEWRTACRQAGVDP
jgi:hypothetical protein